MTNIFQLSHDARLQGWYRLRQSLADVTLESKCLGVDEWWQFAPLVTHYLHTDFVKDWPSPWELLADNEYCYFARGLGMIYTLHLLGVQDIEFVEAKDYNSEDVALVLVDNKFVLNYWPNMVKVNKISDFTICKSISIELLIGKLK